MVTDWSTFFQIRQLILHWRSLLPKERNTSVTAVLRHKSRIFIFFENSLKTQKVNNNNSVVGIFHFAADPVSAVESTQLIPFHTGSLCAECSSMRSSRRHCNNSINSSEQLVNKRRTSVLLSFVRRLYVSGNEIDDRLADRVRQATTNGQTFCCVQRGRKKKK